MFFTWVKPKITSTRIFCNEHWRLNHLSLLNSIRVDSSAKTSCSYILLCLCVCYLKFYLILSVFVCLCFCFNKVVYVVIVLLCLCFVYVCSCLPLYYVKKLCFIYVCLCFIPLYVFSVFVFVFVWIDQEKRVSDKSLKSRKTFSSSHARHYLMIEKKRKKKKKK